LKRILVIGAGGREHALAWRLAKDPLAQVVLCPGNDGARLDHSFQCHQIAADNYAALENFALAEKFDLVVIGPDQALADGLVDRLNQVGVLAFGPSQAAAKVEYSKAFAKEIMAAGKIPTAQARVFVDANQAKAFLRQSPWSSGWALKADGLALGKGVVVTQDLKEAESTVDAFLLGGQVGNAGKTIIIEERLDGREVSAFHICDGSEFIELAYACDHKQLLDGGKGPNTGGMGAFSPVDWMSSEQRTEISSIVVKPLLNEMAKRRTPFRGVLFTGLMMTQDGPRVLEFNARFGDPETQAIMPLIEGDFSQILSFAAKGELKRLAKANILNQELHSVHVVLAAAGYPSDVRRGDSIRIASELLLEDGQGSKVFFAGVKSSESGLVTNGGRVLGFTALGGKKAEARSRAYSGLAKIDFAGKQFRSDVGAL
jgi:phosphoribosylamine--glycine ligase